MSTTPLTSGASQNGASISDTGTFLDFETENDTTASYIMVHNRSGSANSVLINVNTAAKDVVKADNKTTVVAPGQSVTLADENYSNATIFCASGETASADYRMAKREFSFAGGA